MWTIPKRAVSTGGQSRVSINEEPGDALLSLVLSIPATESPHYMTRVES